MFERIRNAVSIASGSAEISYPEEQPVKQAVLAASTLGKIFAYILSHEAKHEGYETGGILTGTQLGDILLITSAYPAKKVQATHTNFQIPPEELLRIDAQRRQECEQRFVGIFHLHPGFGCFLSQTDVEATARFCRFYGASVNLVVSTSNGRIEYKFFTVEDGKSTEVQHRITMG